MKYSMSQGVWLWPEEPSVRRPARQAVTASSPRVFLPSQSFECTCTELSLYSPAILLHPLLFYFVVHHMALFQLLRDVGYRDPQLDHQHQHMVGQVADLEDGFLLVALGAGDDDLGALLADFFEDLFKPLVKQVACVAALLGVLLAAFNQGIEPFPGELFEFVRDIDRVEKAALGPGVAGRAFLDHLDDKGVLVTVGGDRNDTLHIAGSFALAPDLL